MSRFTAGFSIVSFLHDLSAADEVCTATELGGCWKRGPGTFVSHQYKTQPFSLILANSLLYHDYNLP